MGKGLEGMEAFVKIIGCPQDRGGQIVGVEVIEILSYSIEHVRRIMGEVCNIHWITLLMAFKTSSGVIVAMHTLLPPQVAF
jgi:hypothetical protein